jgi:ATP synthase protein I
VIFVAKNKKSTEEELLEKIKKESAKKIRSKKEGNEIMFGLGSFGIVGWSIAIPTILGIAGGAYLDRNYPQGFSWTLTLLFSGVILGSFNAWYWVKDKTRNDE